MAIPNDSKKRPVWQDIVPTKTRPTVTQIGPKRIKPKLKYNIKLPKISKKIFIFICSSLLLIVLFIAIAFFIINANQNSIEQNLSENKNNQTDATLTNIGVAEPEFVTITPNHKSISELGGWTKISPDGAAPVYTYIDRIDGININVSEQSLPEDFKTDTEQKVKNLATSFNASQKITTNEKSIYIGQSRDGAQSIIFSKNNLLVFIKTDKKINNSSIVSYINSLE